MKPKIYILSSFVLLITVIGLTMVHGQTSPYVTLTLPSQPSSGYASSDSVQLHISASGGIYNLVLMTIVWGDNSSPANFTINAPNLDTSLYHTYGRTGSFQIFCYILTSQTGIIIENSALLSILRTNSPSFTTTQINPTQGGSFPYISVTFPNMPPSGYQPNDLVDVQTYLYGAAHNITQVTWNFGDNSPQAVTPLNPSVPATTLQSYHLYKLPNVYTIYVNATTNLCYAGVACQYFSGTGIVQVEPYTTHLSLQVTPTFANVSAHVPFHLIVTVASNVGPIPYANITLSVNFIPANGATGLWYLIGTIKGDPYGELIYDYYPLTAGLYGFNATYGGDSLYASSQMLVVGNTANDPMPVPEFPNILMLIPIVMCMASLVVKKWNSH